MNVEFNTFKFLEIEKKELFHSKFIVSLLKKEDDYFRMFLKEIGCDYFFKDIKYGEYEIKLEKGLTDNEKYGRADIWISSHKADGNKNKRIIIENKMHTGDQEYQLYRYRKYLDNNNRDGLLYYLTLEGKTASAHSSGFDEKDNNKTLCSNNPQKGYSILSYQKHIIPWLEKILMFNKDENINDLINQYMVVIDELTEVQKWIENDISVESIEGTKSIEYRIELELHFWVQLEIKIINELFNSSENYYFDKRNKFSHNKIKEFYDNKISENRKDYGLVFNNIRIEKNNEQLRLSKGHFTNTGQNPTWIEQISKEININLNQLRNKTDAEEKLNHIFKEIENLWL
jgi:hypothetical protein